MGFSSFREVKKDKSTLFISLAVVHINHIAFIGIKKNRKRELRRRNHDCKWLAKLGRASQKKNERHRYQDKSCTDKYFLLTIHLAQVIWFGHHPEMGKSSL